MQSFFRLPLLPVQLPFPVTSCFSPCFRVKCRYCINLPERNLPMLYELSNAFGSRFCSRETPRPAPFQGLSRRADRACRPFRQSSAPVAVSPAGDGGHLPGPRPHGLVRQTGNNGHGRAGPARKGIRRDDRRPAAGLFPLKEPKLRFLRQAHGSFRRAAGH